MGPVRQNAVNLNHTGRGSAEVVGGAYHIAAVVANGSKRMCRAEASVLISFKRFRSRRVRCGPVRRYCRRGN
jgi:hypothetical protein